MLLSYACSFPHNNIHTYIMYIFRVSISMCKCSYDSIPLYSIHVKVYCYRLTLNCCCPLSNCYCLTLSCYCPISNSYCLTLSCYCLTLNCYCLTFPIVTVWLFQPLLFDFELLLFRHLNCHCLHFELLLSRHLNCYCLHFELLLSRHLNCYCLHIELLLFTHWTVTVQLLLSRHWTVTVWTFIRFLTISRLIELYFKRD
jgi:hypothetical protein